MKIRKNGKVVNLTESDLQKIVKRVISERGGQTLSAEKKMDFIESLPNEEVVKRTKNCVFRHLKKEGKLTDEIKTKVSSYDKMEDLEGYINDNLGYSDALNCIITTIRIDQKEFQ